MDENSLLADLRKCRFYCGSWDKRFAFGVPDPIKMTDVQRKWFGALIYSYRKQLGLKDEWAEAIKNRIITGQPQSVSLRRQLEFWQIEREYEIKEFLSTRRLSEDLVTAEWADGLEDWLIEEPPMKVVY